MSEHTELSRRSLLMKLGIVLNGVVAALVAIPIFGYLLSPLRRNNAGGSDAWISLGPVTEFPVGQTRLATYHNPFRRPWDGQTADIPCWVRRIGDELCTPGLPGAMVLAVRTFHVPLPRRRVLRRWFARLGSP